jgi:transposase
VTLREATVAQRVPAFLPQLKGLRLDRIAVHEDGIDVALTTVRGRARCPRCGRHTRRVHSRYTRRVADLPWSGAVVTLSVCARRFFCARRTCAQRIFCERLPALVAAGARRSHGLRAAQQCVGFALGGRAGTRLAAPLGVGTSRMTLLRLVQATADQPATSDAATSVGRTGQCGNAPLRVVGIDDWAKRKGQTYGTILVDLERHRVVDLLPDRTTESVATWFAAHPGLEVVSRDRGGVYADGARQGAPAAVQVADRWHVLHNVREALERLLTRYHLAVQAANAVTAVTATTAAVAMAELTMATSPPLTASATRPCRPSCATPNALAPPTPSGSCEPGGGGGAAPLLLPLLPAPLPSRPPAKQPTTGRRRDQDARRTRRVARYEQVHALQGQGLSQRTIAQRLHMGKTTVRRLLQAEAFPERRPRTRPLTSVGPFTPYLWERWQAGQRNTAALWRELTARGFTGSASTVRHTLASWRPAPARPGPPPTSAPDTPSSAPTAGAAPAHATHARDAATTVGSPGAAPGAAPLAPPTFSVRQATWLLLRRPEDLDADEARFVTILCRDCPAVERAASLVQGFFTLVRTRAVADLAPWVTRAERSALPELCSFAAGLRRDWAAVEAALTVPWSQGQTEGQVNKLKTLKRQMYGRAGFELLRRRFLHPG